VLFDESTEAGLTWVGRPMEVVRALDSVYVDQARADFLEYVRRTLAASQAAGGRFNPPGEFGALYAASDESTAWEEIAARFRRQGINGLPPEMGMIGILIPVGRYADLTDPSTRSLWEISEAALTADEPSPEQREMCWTVARSVRALADFLVTASVRSEGDNVPLYPDRDGSEIRMELQYADRRAVPVHLLQRPTEDW
jgi:RES domain-containing protein